MCWRKNRSLSACDIPPQWEGDKGSDLLVLEKPITWKPELAFYLRHKIKTFVDTFEIGPSFFSLSVGSLCLPLVETEQVVRNNLCSGTFLLSLLPVAMALGWPINFLAAVE